ncbi:histone H2B-like [Carcharodon carcharias]|uniref:histone H2B-like n=1 Tax=Carcharodon carcharias TaxID=13397 RepID=UPI001B7F243D|nr:histone H2B-like [Carcharodon carcharias]
MPEVAAVAKSGAFHKVSKHLLTKVTKKWRKSCKQSYSTYVYRVLTQAHTSTRISSKVMSVMNSFIVDIFKRIASKASHPIHYNERHTISARENQITIHLMLPGNWPNMSSPKAPKWSPNTQTLFRSSILKIITSPCSPL